jgi:hypothetical protein
VGRTLLSDKFRNRPFTSVGMILLSFVIPQSRNPYAD